MDQNAVIEMARETHSSGFFTTVIEYLICAMGTILAYMVKGVISDAKDMKANMAKHEIESAVKFGRLEGAVETFAKTAEKVEASVTRIHDRIDELVKGKHT